MSIKTVNAVSLRKMNGKEGLVLQGCGGDIKEWQDGINNLLQESGILLENSKFDTIYVFNHNDRRNILFPFDEGVKLDIGKLAIWRITNSNFEGMWLSDYVDNKLSGFEAVEENTEQQKPDCELIGQDGNIFNLMGIASRTLRRNGLAEQATEMCNRITSSAGNYYEALNIIGEYVNITGPEENEDFDEDYDEGMVM